MTNVKKKKQKLLKMAQSGKPRPSHSKHPLGPALCGYTHPVNSSYDPEFSQKIRELRPDWFVNTTIAKKEELLEMARRGEPIPTGKLKQTLNSYILESQSSYDEGFAQQIATICPSWIPKTRKE